MDSPAHRDDDQPKPPSSGNGTDIYIRVEDVLDSAQITPKGLKERKYPIVF